MVVEGARPSSIRRNTCLGLGRVGRSICFLLLVRRFGLFRFVVFIFAIIGGGFTVFGLIDSLFFHTERVLREKVGLGKAA